jgi:hypothetical protein
MFLVGLVGGVCHSHSISPARPRNILAWFVLKLMRLRILIPSKIGCEKSFEFETMFTAQDLILKVHIEQYNMKSPETRH